MTHVLMTADAEGGVWTYASELVRGCAPFGIRFTVAVLGRAPDASSVRELERHGATIQTFPCRLEWMPDCEEDVVRSGAWLETLSDAVRPDVVHVNGYAHAACRFNRPTIVVAHSCVCSWWRAVHGESAPIEWAGYRRRVRRGLAACARVIAPTRAMLEALEREYGTAPASSTIPNGIAETKRPASEKQPFVFAAGRLWDRAKNLRVLDQIAHGLRWPIVTAGQAACPGERGRAPDHAVWLGALERRDVDDWMARAAIYAWPARYEPFGLSVLEAASAGCALVLGDIPSLRELWTGAAVFVPPNDGQEIRRAIDRLIDRPAIRGSLARAARRRARDYTAERMATAYARIYRDIIGARPGTSAVPQFTLRVDAR